jgi:hypothetical protein
MLIKYSNASLSWDTKPASRPTNMAYTRYYGSYATYAEADKAKKKLKRTIRSLALIESL